MAKYETALLAISPDFGIIDTDFWENGLQIGDGYRLSGADTTAKYSLAIRVARKTLTHKPIFIGDYTQFLDFGSEIRKMSIVDGEIYSLIQGATRWTCILENKSGH